MSLVPLNRFSYTLFDRLTLPLDMAEDDQRQTTPYLAQSLLPSLPASPSMAGELFRYRGAAKDGGTLKYVFDAGEQNSPNAVTKEKAAEIAADFMTPSTTYRSARWNRKNYGQRRPRSG